MRLHCGGDAGHDGEDEADDHEQRHKDTHPTNEPAVHVRSLFSRIEGLDDIFVDDDVGLVSPGFYLLGIIVVLGVALDGVVDDGLDLFVGALYAYISAE